MDVKQLDKAIGYGIAIIVGYHLIGIFIPMLTWCVVGLVAFRIYLTYNKR